ncbi:DNA polymerase III subunit delta [Candidatus Pelagibacter sp.]|jgi:DNA polymerase-3 subunit delta|nr:DNA polymerase III subunit delta [Candidatus Pelagibacter sp.]
MLVKYNDLRGFNKDKINYYLFYGPNLGLIEDTIKNIFKPIFSKNIINYDEGDILNNKEEFKEQIFNKSFFDDDKFIIINRATDKIFEIVKEIINTEIEDIKIIIKAANLEKKSKIRNFFENEKKTIITAFYEDNFQSLSLIVQNFFKEKNIKISNEIISLVIRRSKGNRINLNNELEKIFLLSKKNNMINYESISKLTNLFENYDFSELVDCYLLKNRKKTINILNENNPNSEDNILILRSFLFKLKRLKKLKNKVDNKKNIDQTINTFKPPIFWKEKEVVKQQLKQRSLSDIKFLIKKVNNLEVLIKKNSQTSNQILNNFILEN